MTSFIFVRGSNNLTFRKISIWISKYSQKLDIFSKKVFGNFWTFKCQFSGGSGNNHRDLRLWPNVGQICSKWDKSGTCWDQISVHFSSANWSTATFDPSRLLEDIKKWKAGESCVVLLTSTHGNTYVEKLLQTRQYFKTCKHGYLNMDGLNKL